MWWCIRYQDHHLARRRSPFHVQRLSQRCGDCLGSVATPTRVQRTQVSLYLADIGREPKVLRYIRVVLWWMVPVCDEAYAQVFLRLQFP